MAARKRLPRGVWALGFVSLFTDMSSEMIHSLLPVFLVGTLGASAFLLGLLEGAAEATTLFVRMFSGVVSDRLGRRRPFVVIGYGIGAAVRPVFALASTIGWVFAARMIDRVGKGIRSAPRDALLVDITPPEQRGAAFGLRHTFDTLGAVLGPALAIGLMFALTGDVRSVLWFSVLPAVVAMTVLILFVHEPEEHLRRTALPRIHWRTLKRLPAPYWSVAAIGAVLTLARFSEAFLVLKAEETGLGIELAPLMLMVMSAAYSLCAYPAGVLSDRIDRGGMLVVGVGVLIIADVVLATAGQSMAATLGGAALWGIHLGLTQGLLSKLIADSSPPELRGTAFGTYSLITGVAVLIASVLAGMLWNAFGSNATFTAGAIFSALALAGLLLALRR